LRLPYHFPAIISHAGAILEPSSVPPCKKDTPFLLIHNQNDDVFDWHERYLPMKYSLVNNGYHVKCVEKECGNHKIYDDDVMEAVSFLKSL
jgi:predicted esterase